MFGYFFCGFHLVQSALWRLPLFQNDPLPAKHNKSTVSHHGGVAGCANGRVAEVVVKRRPVRGSRVGRVRADLPDRRAGPAGPAVKCEGGSDRGLCGGTHLAGVIFVHGQASPLSSPSYASDNSTTAPAQSHHTPLTAPPRSAPPHTRPARMSSPTPTPAPLPAPRRVVSGLTSDGRSTIAFDGPIEMNLSTSEGKSFNVGQVWTTRETPASVQTGGGDEARPMPGTIVAKGEWGARCWWGSGWDDWERRMAD